MDIVAIIRAILEERKRQDEIHPDNSVRDYLPILIEEIGEVGRALQNNDYENQKEELIQVGAVVVRWLQELE
jgi:NTP pyrophosphatase (non-canonical NTP hydrolase)